MITDDPQKPPLPLIEDRIRAAELASSISDAEAAKKNSNFVQVYREAMPELRNLITKSPLAAKLFLTIVENMDRTGGLLASHATLADIIGTARPNIVRLVSILEENNFLRVVRSPGDTNLFCVNPDVAWSTYSTGKRYAMFNVRAIIPEQTFNQQPRRVRALIPPPVPGELDLEGPQHGVSPSTVIKPSETTDLPTE
jgi:hypothetical protein